MGFRLILPGETPQQVEIQNVNLDSVKREVVTIKDVEYTFRWCPAGTFMMGSPETEKERNSNETRHRVTLTQGFWMLETEVTQEMWELDKTSVSGWASVKLATIGESCRALLRDSIRSMIDWIFERLDIDPHTHRGTGRRLGSVLQRLGLAVEK